MINDLQRIGTHHIDNLTLVSDTYHMNESKDQLKPTDSDQESVWQKTQHSNLIRYVPSGMYFARLRVDGKLIRASLKTNTLSVAVLRLADRTKE